MKYLSHLGPRNALIALHDALATIAAVVLSFYLRFEDDSLLERLPMLWHILPYFTVASVVVCYVFGLTTTKWRFVSLPDVLNIIRVASVLAVGLLALDYVFVAPNVYGSFFFGKTTIIIYWVLQVAFLIGARFVYRYFRYTRTRNKARAAETASTLVIGLAADADIFLRGIESGAVRDIHVLGIMSPSRADLGQLVRSVPVLGGTDDLRDIIGDFDARGRKIQRVVLTPSMFESEQGVEALLVEARRLGLIVNRLPALGDHRLANQLAPVAVEDLLLRPSVRIDYTRLEQFVGDKSVVVTGGGGSIGSELAERVVSLGARKLLIIEHAETALYHIVEKLKAMNSTTVVHGRIADIRDADRINHLFEEFKPDIVFHAAALKHVPILEQDWEEGVKTNVFGSINVAEAASRVGVEAMVMISTDKAIEPVSMLGLTKRFAEMYCQTLDTNSLQTGTRFLSVRFGNVLASNGSVVPKFKAQIEAGGPVTVTHPDMVRYFMTIREACDLVVTAASYACSDTSKGSSVFVLNMGQPVRITDLAERMIRLSGLQPGRDIQIVFSGIRPGERLHEIIFAKHELTADIGVDGVLAAKPNEPSRKAIEDWTEALHDAVGARDRGRIRSVLKQAIPEFVVDADEAAGGAK